MIFNENTVPADYSLPHAAKLISSLHATMLVESMISRHIKGQGFWDEVSKMATEYARTGYAKASALVPPTLVSRLETEIDDAFLERGVRRDLVISATDNTPRQMSNLRYVDIRDSCPSIVAAYDSRMLKLCISAIVGETVFECPWEHERYIATLLHSVGDTHGWHWDDYAFSLIWIFRAPAPELGGNLEFIPNTSWDKGNPKIADLLQSNPAEIRTHASGDLYIFRSDQLLHRVTPISPGVERMIVNMVYAGKADLNTAKTHETMTQLFA